MCFMQQTLCLPLPSGELSLLSVAAAVEKPHEEIDIEALVGQQGPFLNSDGVHHQTSIPCKPYGL